MDCACGLVAAVIAVVGGSGGGGGRRFSEVQGSGICQTQTTVAQDV